MGLHKMNCEAYSAGWKKAKANNPSDSSAWTLGGCAERAIRPFVWPNIRLMVSKLLNLTHFHAVEGIE